jgi:hypothetical protein
VTEPARDLTIGDGPDLDVSGQPYPPWAFTAEQKRRWDYSLDMAQKLMGDGEDSMLGEGPTPSSSADIPSAARAIYQSDVPTGDPPEAVPPGHPLAGQAQQDDAAAGEGASSEGEPEASPRAAEEPLQTGASSQDARSDRETPGGGASDATVPPAEPSSTA